MENLDVLQKNIEVFVDAAAIVLKSRRVADQVGTLLAGCWLCYTTEEVTPAQAREWLEGNKWGEHVAVDSGSDLDRLLSKIATTRIIVSANHDKISITIGEAIESASGNAALETTLGKIENEAHDELKRIGIKIDHSSNSVIIANSCFPMRKLLEGTAWSTAWARVLKEHDKAETVDPTYFSAGMRSRAVKLPLSAFINNLK